MLSSEIAGVSPNGLTALLGEGSQVVGTTLIREGPRARVSRLTIERSDGISRSVICKQITDAGERGFTDWASLSFLSEIPAAVGLIPRLLSGDFASRNYLLEDLGPSVSLEDVFQGADAGAAWLKLMALSRIYARLHASTLGDEPRFLELRRVLPVGEGHGRATEANHWSEARPKVTAWLEALNVEAPAGFDVDLDRVAQRYAEPGPYLTFTHGDPAPSNNHVDRETVRLLDFEYGAYRHALYDLTAWYVLCPLPEPLVEAMRAAYRKELMPALPQIADNTLFQEEWALLVAYRVIAMLTWVPPTVLEQNWAWAGEWTAREAVVTAICRLATAVEGQPSLAGVREVIDRAKSALLHRFPQHEGALPKWPALLPVE